MELMKIKVGILMQILWGCEWNSKGFKFQKWNKILWNENSHFFPSTLLESMNKKLCVKITQFNVVLIVKAREKRMKTFLFLWETFQRKGGGLVALYRKFMASREDMDVMRNWTSRIWRGIGGKWRIFRL